MFRMFQNNFPNFPESKFVLLFKVNQRFTSAYLELEDVKDKLYEYEIAAYNVSFNTFISELRDYLNELHENLENMKKCADIMMTILVAYHARQAAKPEYNNDAVI